MQVGFRIFLLLFLNKRVDPKDVKVLEANEGYGSNGCSGMVKQLEFNTKQVLKLSVLKHVCFKQARANLSPDSMQARLSPQLVILHNVSHGLSSDSFSWAEPVMFLLVYLFGASKQKIFRWLWWMIDDCTCMSGNVFLRVEL